MRGLRLQGYSQGRAEIGAHLVQQERRVGALLGGHELHEGAEALEFLLAVPELIVRNLAAAAERHLLHHGLHAACNHK